MNIETLVLAIAVAHEARVSLFVHGVQGLGKSKACQLYSKNNHHFPDSPNPIPFGYIDLRCATMESSEIRGLPDKDLETQTTVYFCPEELPRGEWINSKGETFGKPGDPKPEGDDWVLHRGILVLEEINRAEDDVLQAIFQLIYDFRVGNWVMPTGWSIVATGNPTGGNFMVNQFMHEDAFKDRFIHVTVNIDDDYTKSWMTYMHRLDGIDSDITDHITQFCTLQKTHLSDATAGDPITVKPSPRSWEMLAKVEQALKKFTGVEKHEDLRMEILSGLIGQSIAASYINAQVVVTPKQVIYDFARSKEAIETLNRNQIQALSWGVKSHVDDIKDEDWKEGGKVIENLIAFGSWMLKKGKGNRDLAVAYFNDILKREQPENVRHLSFANPSLQRLIKSRNVTKCTGPLWNAMTSDRDLADLIKSAHLGEMN